MILTVPTKKYEEANACKKRDCYDQLADYLHSSSTRVCALYGLRKTGKRTMMFQAMKEIGLEKSGYILCEEGDNYKELCRVIDEYKDQGKKAIFIDEITKLSDFITSSASLADYYSGSGVKIVITGTDNLGIEMATRDELYDRTVNIHTTYISYGEYCRLLENTDLEDFIHYGGVLSHGPEVTARDFYDFRTAARYIDSAISENISNTFFKRRMPMVAKHRYYRLIELHDRNTLIPIITAIVTIYGNIFTKRVLTKFCKDKPYADMALRFLDWMVETGMLLHRGHSCDDCRFLSLVAIKCWRGIDYELTDAAVDQIDEHLTDLELFVSVHVISCSIKATNYSYETAKYICQPGLQYCQTMVLIDSLLESIKINLPPEDRTPFFEEFDREAKRRIMVITAFNDVQHFFDEERYKIFQMQFTGENPGEIDMVIRDKEKKGHYCFTITYSDRREESQLKNLLFEPYCNLLNEYFGTRKGAAVLYLGDTAPVLPNGIRYVNISKFLTEIYLHQEEALKNLFTAADGC